MSLDIACDVCRVKIVMPGALVFGPPEQGNICLKWHLCRDCFAMFRSLINRVRAGAIGS